MDGTVEAFHEIAGLHAQTRYNGAYPTTLSSDKKSILDTLFLYEKAIVNNYDGAGFIGLHLEGPYFAMNQRGAQDPKFIRNPDPREYMEIFRSFKFNYQMEHRTRTGRSIGNGPLFKEKGILPAIAHTDAIYEEVQEAFD